MPDAFAARAGTLECAGLRFAGLDGPLTGATVNGWGLVEAVRMHDRARTHAARRVHSDRFDALTTLAHTLLAVDAGLLTDVSAALTAIRGAKSQAKVSMKTEATRADFTGPAEQLERLRTVERDLRAVGRLVGAVTWTPSDTPLAVDTELAQA